MVKIVAINDEQVLDYRVHDIGVSRTLVNSKQHRAERSLASQRLLIADASIMPTATRGNTNAPSIMIGESASDLLVG